MLEGDIMTNKENNFLSSEMMNTGGGCWIRLIYLTDKKENGMLIAISDEYVAQYDNLESVFDSKGKNGFSYID